MAKQPRYFFRFAGVEEAAHHVPNLDAYHRWSPPKARGSNVYSSRDNTELFYCDGQSIQTWSELPEGSEIFKTYTIYYSHGQIWVVNYNAVHHQVGDGIDIHGNGVQPQADSDGPYGTWQTLSFDHDEVNPYSSIVTYGGEHRTLRSQRLDQIWPHTLLPSTYHSHESNHTTNVNWGGLSGDLPLILALLAFSCRPEKLESYFLRRFKNGTFHMHGHSHGRQEKRGILVAVWTHPNLCTKDTLEEYEEGLHGRIFL